MRKEIFLKTFEEALRVEIAEKVSDEMRRKGKTGIADATCHATRYIPYCMEVLRASLYGITEVNTQDLEKCDVAIRSSYQVMYKLDTNTYTCVNAIVDRIRHGLRIHEKESDLIAVFEGTKDFSGRLRFPSYDTIYGETNIFLDRNKTQAMVNGTHTYCSELDDSLKQLDLPEGVDVRVPKPSASVIAPVVTEAQVMPMDSLSAAETLINRGMNPLVLNMANKTVMGGGVEVGLETQEADLFRCSNYHLALYPLQQLPRDGKWLYSKPIPEFGSIYSPGVSVIRDREKNGERYALRVPFTVSCIAVAGYNLEAASHKELTEELAGTKLLQKTNAGIPILDAFKECTEEKIKHILEMAILKGHDSLVLGALSCHNEVTATQVAMAFEKALMLPEYKNRFKNITFAILPLGTYGQRYVNIFRDMVNRILFGNIASNPVVPTAVRGADVEVKESVEQKEARELHETLELSAREMKKSIEVRVAREERELHEAIELSKKEQRMCVQPPAEAIEQEKAQEERNIPDQDGEARPVILSGGLRQEVAEPPPAYDDVIDTAYARIHFGFKNKL